MFLAIDPTRSDDPQIAGDAERVRRLLGVPVTAREIEIVYGSVPARGDNVRIVTRSVIGILTELGAQIEVPASEVNRHATLPTVRLLEVATSIPSSHSAWFRR